MRPVNLIPPEDRRGDRAPLRSGPLSYVVIGALAVVLLAVTALVMTQGTIADREAELAQLEVDRDAAAAEAAALAPYAEFAALKQVREATLKSLAESRFDWERVLRELALIMPSDISLASLDGAASGDSAEATTSEATTGIEGPSLIISGCGKDHNAVGRFVAALEDIDGVTRVGLESSEKGASGGSSGSASAPAEGSDAGCANAAAFALTVAFDNAAQVEAVPGELPAPATAPAPATPVESNSATEQTGEAKKAANVVPGVAKP